MAAVLVLLALPPVAPGAERNLVGYLGPLTGIFGRRRARIPKLHH